MAHFEVPKYEQEPAALHETYEAFRVILGFVPNLYATIGYSANALNSYTRFTAEQNKGTFHGKDREAIFLIVSQLNGCHYCLASHTQSAIRNKWTEEDTLMLRKGTYPENKWLVIYRVIKSILDHKGQVKEELLEEFYHLGYTEVAIMDLLALVMVMSFTNYAYRMTDIPIDFPLAKEI
ncbi:carboxymuconolactone decarboxylase family protein [Mucilaginibacter aquaedulcis]|uniref:carboxymuconolactone decarboxylase family protein n=1 Tax=Mucilaginibacter aquaedulcis TaxID=1187081 RepID=UPI0025B5C86C|nr:carboxymuconolactone decarboxylase family protein [Mucilaginibacter aquaedulcis]MDN3548848.1 carboxymuconolactone decarboxylase family protein [Mucilaginibacter aquaedulcis]